MIISLSGYSRRRRENAEQTKVRETRMGRIMEWWCIFRRNKMQHDASRLRYQWLMSFKLVNFRLLYFLSLSLSYQIFRTNKWSIYLNWRKQKNNKTSPIVAIRNCFWTNTLASKEAPMKTNGYYYILQNSLARANAVRVMPIIGTEIIIPTRGKRCVVKARARAPIDVRGEFLCK